MSMDSQFAHLDAEQSLCYPDFLEEILVKFSDRPCAQLAAQDLHAQLLGIYNSLVQGVDASACVADAYDLIESSEEFFIAQRISKACRQAG